jgi:glyoxylase-like metal-dependent hydrolase (beta-lactamase superfamily II)/rhodanese-related sulfurtransferase
MQIKQFEDKNLSHFSYAIVSHGEVALIDPSRGPQPYYDFAQDHNARITTVIETHPHADLVSSHLEINKTTGATIYVSKLLGAEYVHETFDEDDAIILGNVTLKALNTPGHSPDSISILLIDENDKEVAVFSGDTLFIGDCGRPDLRETAGSITMTRKELAAKMYHSLRDKYLPLKDDVILYPAHGAGSLCGKGLSEENSSKMGAEKLSNWSLQNMTEDEFVEKLLADQPFIPKYFSFEVGLNRKGAENFSTSISGIKKVNAEDLSIENIPQSAIVIDTRPQKEFKKGHLKNAINLMNDRSFETWLGSIVDPSEKFYVIAENESLLGELIARIAKIGYEQQIDLAIAGNIGKEISPNFDSSELKDHENNFTVIDLRNPTEISARKVFEHSIKIPLYELRERLGEIPVNKPIVVHCEAGFRSAAGSSIIKSRLNGSVQVFDLSEDVKTF